MQLFKKFLFVVSVLLLSEACKKDAEDEMAKTPQLLFVEQTIPNAELAVGGGFVNIQVDWAFTQWSVAAGDVVEGNSFITQILPATFGSKSQAQTTTAVKVSFKQNDTYNKNVQKLVLRSLTDETLIHTITLTQAAKVLEITNFTIYPDVVFQTIAGFGGANMIWGSDFLNAAEVKKVFGTDDGELGFSIMRVRVGMYESDWPALVSTLQEAMKYNVKIIASPWSPPPALKTNNNQVDGALKPENYGAYATHLNKFVEYMNAQGINIYSVSIQNEPDITVTYESCRWTAQEMLTFIKEHASTIKNTKISAAESFNFKQSFTDVLLNDADAVSKFDIVAGHIYGSGLASYPLAEQKGKEIWMTEYLMNQNSGANTNNWNTSEAAIWNETMQMVGTMHDAMRYNWNAYIWWYIRRYYSFLGDGEKGTTRSNILKRGYAFSHFSKLIRPGYKRIAITSDKTVSLNITAYAGDGKTVVVIINPALSAIDGVQLSHPGSVQSVMAYTTSEFVNVQQHQNILSNGKVLLTIPAKSITTVVME